MSSAARAALNTSDIIHTILQHVVEASASSLRKKYDHLISCSLITRGWVEPVRGLLNRVVTFWRGTPQLEQWLYAANRHEVETLDLIFIDEYPFKEGGKWSYSAIGEVFRQVRGVELLTIDLRGQVDLSPEWFTFDGFKGESILAPSVISPAVLTPSTIIGVKRLMLASPFAQSDSSLKPSFMLEALHFQDSYPQLSRDWTHTCSLLTRTKHNRPLALVHLELQTLDSNYPTYLCPSFPLAANLTLSCHGSLLPFATNLKLLAIPKLLPHPDLHNLAIFGSAASQLDHLFIDALTPESTSAIPFLRFFPNLAELTITEFVSLPLAGILPPEYVKLFKDEGKGDVMGELVKLIQAGWLGKLERVTIETWKYLRPEQVEDVEVWLEAEGVELDIVEEDPIPLTQNEVSYRSQPYVYNLS
jgi:hypothetical protein